MDNNTPPQLIFAHPPPPPILQYGKSLAGASVVTLAGLAVKTHQFAVQIIRSYKYALPDPVIDRVQ